MAWIRTIRIVFLLLGGLVGALIVSKYVGGGSVWAGVIVGFFSAAIIVLMELRLDTLSLKETVLGVIGLAAGLTLASLLSLPAKFLFDETSNSSSIMQILFYLFFGYVGMMLALEKRAEIPLFGGALGAKPKILDTSVIIDGRIADIVDNGFIEGSIVIPRFVLQELQHIADSSDPLKRNRGRRGLEILNRIQKHVKGDVRIMDRDFPHIFAVDEKLVELARVIQGVIMTNDFNLNRVAELQGVKVLNINELTNAVKPVVMAGEMMRIKVLKEGKEAGQGIAYLDDGTMVVVDNGKTYIGQVVEVSVTSVLQTSAGRMIFTRKEEH